MIVLYLIAQSGIGHAQQQNVSHTRDFYERKQHVNQVAVEIYFLISNSLASTLSGSMFSSDSKPFHRQIVRTGDNRHLMRFVNSAVVEF
jgi:hypothetical protein